MYYQLLNNLVKIITNTRFIMLELLKEIILDGQHQKINPSVPRHLQYKLISGKAFTCMGVRRSGKSTLLSQIIERLIRKGVDRENIFTLNFFDDRLRELQRGNLSLVLDAYYGLYPLKKNTETVYFFFDEIQMVNDWESFVDRLLRTENSQVFLTGSSSKMLSKEIATQMRGRSLAWELFPFSFREFLDYKNIDWKKLTSKARLLVQNCFKNEYWEKGGFPEVRNVSREICIMIHQEYFKTIIHRDIIERYDAFHPQAVLELAYRLVNNVGSMYSINRLTAYLKSFGFRISKTFVGDCLGWFEDAYFLFSVKVFDASLSRQNANPKKIYCVDHSIVTSITPGILVNSGHLLENLVYLHLRRKSSSIYYYRTKGGREVDFIWLDSAGEKNLLQVCESIKIEKTRDRELAALAEAMKEQELKSAYLITQDETEDVRWNDYSVTVMPIWRFLL